MLDGQATAILEKAIELALKGDRTALRLCLERISPPRKERLIDLSLPVITEASHASAALTSQKLGKHGTINEFPAIVHIESCEVWRYFARSLDALQRIAADQYHGKLGAPGDWDILQQIPPEMRTHIERQQDRLDFLRPYALADEPNWVALANYAGKRGHQNRKTFLRFMNNLVGLGRVRPWLTWPDSPRRVGRPQLTYSSSSLLSQLALQLCLRISRIDSFLLCVHCQKQYAPVARAPRRGVRTFCPECREQGIPQNYATRDHRKRKRLEAAAALATTGEQYDRSEFDRRRKDRTADREETEDPSA